MGGSGGLMLRPSTTSSHNNGGIMADKTDFITVTKRLAEALDRQARWCPQNSAAFREVIAAWSEAKEIGAAVSRLEEPGRPDGGRFDIIQSLSLRVLALEEKLGAVEAEVSDHLGVNFDVDEAEEAGQADQPRAWTPDEMKEKFLRLVLATAEEWAGYPDKTPLGRCEGLAFSLLATFDGESGGFPAVDLALRPHEDDKAFQQGLGENWIEDGTTINATSYLHEEWHDFVRRERPDRESEPAPKAQSIRFPASDEQLLEHIEAAIETGRKALPWIVAAVGGDRTEEGAAINRGQLAVSVLKGRLSRPGVAPEECMAPLGDDAPSAVRAPNCLKCGKKAPIPSNATGETVLMCAFCGDQRKARPGRTAAPEAPKDVPKQVHPIDPFELAEVCAESSDDGGVQDEALAMLPKDPDVAVHALCQSLGELWRAISRHDIPWRAR